MADNPLGGLGNLMGGGLGKTLSGLMPEGSEKDMLKASSEVSELKAQEKELLAEIGKAAYEQNPDAWPHQSEKIKLIRMNLAEAEKSLNEVEQQQAQEEAAQAATDAATTCPSCGVKNPEGVKFCQECGTKLHFQGPKVCVSCGAKLEPGTRFCGECGTAQGD